MFNMGVCMKLYTVYDKVARQYSAPNMAINHGVAFRQFQQLLVTMPEHIRVDYELYCIADFSIDDGSIDGYKMIKIDGLEDVENE